MIASMRRLLSALAIVIALGGLALAQAPKSSTPPKPISMDELHRTGGVPRGWKFTLPAGGDPRRGREVFAKLECAKCHEIKPDFPKTGGAGDVGPELTGMGAHHPAEYFAESVLDPNAVILAGPGYIGPDGRSIMPDYRDSLSVDELVDLVADATSGEPVPYLPVTAVIRSVETAPRTLRLSPMIGDSGFHYGADVTLPEDTIKLTLTLGVATLKTMGPAARRFAKPVTLSFDWE